MSIPKLTKDLAVIQKLSDLPNSTEGLTAQQLKEKFDESGLTIQQWINEVFVPALTAENIPYAGSSELNADTVQAAVELVHSQIRDAASGAIPNGAVTAEKLSANLLERVFGGRPWVSMETPDNTDNKGTDFPVGQIWLRPAFTVTNVAVTSWATSGCSTTVSENKVRVTGNSTSSTVSVTQSRSSMGQSGDRVWVLFDIQNKDSEITGLTININNEGEQDASAGAFSATLADGSLSVKITATFPAASLADGSFDIANYTVVNVDQVVRQTTDAHEISDWEAYLRGLLPLDTHTSPVSLYIQTINGSWWQMTPEVLPLERGGTGMSSVSYGDLFYGTADNRLEKLPKPNEDGCFLQYKGGRLQWVSADVVAQSQSFLRTQYGNYNGNNNVRTITLPVSPKRIQVIASSERATDTFCLEQGHSISSKIEVGINAGVRLSGNALIFWSDSTSAPVGNRSGQTYYWTANY